MCINTKIYLGNNDLQLFLYQYLNMKIIQILSLIEIQENLVDVHNGHDDFDDQELNV